MEGKGGRPPGRQLTPLEIKHLELLLDIRARASSREKTFSVQLEDFVLELLDEGASAYGIGRALGVAHNTVSNWAKHARQRRDS